MSDSVGEQVRPVAETAVLARLSPLGLAGVVGPLIEVPVLVALVHVALRAGRRSFPGDPALPTPVLVPAARRSS